MTNPSMSNTSQVDAFPATSEDMARSRVIHPEFWDNVVPHALSVTLEPGDLLFFPPGWWHAMRSEETSFSVSMWF
jgi:ribosomal protein L16 Arg81 hydroxylase